MNERDKKEIIDAVVAAIKVTVNGKIDRLSDTVAGIHERLDEQDKAIAPAIETIDTLRNGRKFILWIAAPIAALGGMIAFINTIR